jgi:hypothetical protein
VEVNLQSTTKIVKLTIEGEDGTRREVPARIWEGRTASGIPCHAYITRIAVADNLDASEFERELVEHRRATPAIEAIPTRLII